MSYQALDENTVQDYVRNNIELRHIIDKQADLTADEVGDGNLNLVFVVKNVNDTSQAVVVKQALPYLRVIGESWPLTRDRMRFETQALLCYNDLAPGLAPTVFSHDDEMSLVVMEYLGNHEVMRKPLVARKRFPNFADQISTFLANILFKTSDMYLSGLNKKALQKQYINPELCKIQEDFVFTNPYMLSQENNWNPELDLAVSAVRHNMPLKREIVELKAKYMTQAQALIHSDLHTGSIMVNSHDTKVIDPEFSFFGPMGYDVGALLANLVLNFGSHYAHTPDKATRDNYQVYLLDLMHDIWTGFATKFEALWIEHNNGSLVPNNYWAYPSGDEAFKVYRHNFIRQLLQDTAGLGACESLRRILGIVSVWDISSITDNKQRAVAERFVINVSSRWIMERANFDHIEDLIGIVREESEAFAIN